MSRGIELAGTLPRRIGRQGRSADRLGDLVLHGLCLVASVLAVVAIGAVVYQVIHGASSSISRFGPGFLVHTGWLPNLGNGGQGTFGGAAFLFGTIVTSFATMLLAVPIGVAIALYLSMLAPERLRRVIGPLVEMLAAIPSVILGFWGIIVLAPFLKAHLEPLIHGALGFLPIFGAAQTTGTGLFIASLILTIMVVPIVA